MKRYPQVLRSLGRWAILLACCGQTPSLEAQQGVTVSGVIGSPNGIEEASLSISQTDPSFPMSIFHVPNAGNYSVNLLEGGNYTLRPEYDDNPLNGVSSWDIFLIGLHISGEKPFTSPYELIAADIDANGVIDGNDTFELRRVILGIFPTFPTNTSWRFVPANYVFPNPLQPFPFPEEIATGHLTGNLSGLDFIAIKIGDLNGSAISGAGGPYYQSIIRGQVRIDQNGNCLADPGEPPLGNWMVHARSGTTQYYATTAEDGTYYLLAPAATYDLWLSPPNPLWLACPDTIFGLQLEDSDTDTLDFSAQALAECPLLEVSLSAPLLRRCFGNQYQVYYCNKGTVAAENARIEVEFDPYFEITSSSVPWTNVNGNTYTFELGDVPAGFCDGIAVYFTLSCDAVLGQTHCSTAHIFPDSLCNPLTWTGPELQISGECQGDNVVFTITNDGPPMTEAVDYVVIEDIMIQMVSSGSIQLGSGESQTIALPANGSTWRLEVDQPVGYIWNMILSAAVEGCGENGQGTFSLGIVTQFPDNDESPFEDEDCRENVGSFDPNDKQGFPRGVGAQHFIGKNQEIEYLVRFQNTGTDTAFKVILLDTLSEWLDPGTLRPLGASHAYAWQLTGAGTLQFVFDDILLPDSNVNEAASHGYLKFAVKPKPDLPDGTVVENQAAIFFDFNAPVITNRTWHTLGEQFLNVSNLSFRPGLTLDVWPNPTAAEASFFLKSAVPLKGRLRVFDPRGREVQAQQFSDNKFTWNAAELTPGLYFFRLEDEAGVGLAAGKVLVVR